jgi:hypothetical protein
VCASGCDNPSFRDVSIRRKSGNCPRKFIFIAMLSWLSQRPSSENNFLGTIKKVVNWGFSPQNNSIDVIQNTVAKELLDWENPTGIYIGTKIV